MGFWDKLKEKAADVKANYEQKKELDKEIKGLESQLKSNLSDMKEIVEQKNLIDQQVFAMYEQIDNLNEQIASYTGMIADTQVKLDEAQAHLDELNAKNKARIRAMEEDGKISYWSVLFQASSFSDLLDRLNMVEEIAAADQRRLKEMSDAAKEVEATKVTMEQERAELEQSKKEMEASQVELEAKRNEADKLLADLIATGDEYQKLIDGGLLPIPRFGKPEDVADMVEACCTGLMDYAAGQVLNADGGFSLRRL